MSNQNNTASTNVVNSAMVATPSKAAPLGVTVKSPIMPGFGPGPKVCEVLITLLEVIRGKEAETKVISQDVSNKPPKAGFEYVLTRIKVNNARTGTMRNERGGKQARALPYTIMEGQLIAVSPDGEIEYELPTVVKQPQPEVIGVTLAPDESREGWILLQVPVDEKKPLLIFKRESPGYEWGGIGYAWFQLF
jgi:hypothetical protein